MSVPFDWAVLVATVNGRSFVGMAGIRDPDALCEAFRPGEPGKGRCDTDGHYMCEECAEISLRELRRRRELCEECGAALVHVGASRHPDHCQACDGVAS
jgi:hypothetical protein